MNFPGSNVLVTGGAGFIGSHLTELLVSQDACVSVLDNLSTGYLANLDRVGSRIHFLSMDVRRADWKELLTAERYDVIMHLAANAYVPPSVENPVWDNRLNFAATLRLLEVLRRLNWQGTLIYASSAAVYGNPARIPIREQDPTIPISPYGAAKLAAERYTSIYSQIYGLRTASLRIFSVYGPRQQKQVVYDLIQKILADPNELFMHGDGTQIRDFNYVEDTAAAAITIALRGELRGEVYNVGSGRECSIRELADCLCGLLERHPHYIFSGSVRSGDPEKWSVDISRLQSLGYQPAVSLEQGLERTVAWYLTTQSMKRSEAGVPWTPEEGRAAPMPVPMMMKR